MIQDVVRDKGVKFVSDIIAEIEKERKQNLLPPIAPTSFSYEGIMTLLQTEATKSTTPEELNHVSVYIARVRDTIKKKMGIK